MAGRKKTKRAESRGPGRPKLYEDTTSVHFRANQSFVEDVHKLSEYFSHGYRSKAAFLQDAIRTGALDLLRKEWRRATDESGSGRLQTARLALSLGIRVNGDGQIELPLGGGLIRMMPGRARPKAPAGWRPLDPLRLALLQYYGPDRINAKVEFVNGDNTDLRKANLRLVP